MYLWVCQQCGARWERVAAGDGTAAVVEDPTSGAEQTGAELMLEDVQDEGDNEMDRADKLEREHDKLRRKVTASDATALARTDVATSKPGVKASDLARTGMHAQARGSW